MAPASPCTILIIVRPVTLSQLLFSFSMFICIFLFSYYSVLKINSILLDL